jgi:hypothetical protein
MRRRLGLALAAVFVIALGVNAPAQAAYTWEGTWRSTFGEIKMTASGSGTYPNCGTLSPTELDGRTNKGEWKECASNGKYEFHMSPGGGSFDGSYTRGESASCVSPPCDWDGTCIAGACLQNSAEDERPAKGERVTVAGISGEVAYRLGAGNWRPLKQGDKLPQNAEIFTGVDSRVTMKLSDGSSFELRELTQILVQTLERTGEDRLRVKVQLKVGEIKARVDKEKALDTNFDIQTPTATAGVRATIFSVFYDASAKAAIVSTTRGSVSVDPAARGLSTTLVPAGKELEVTAKAMSKLAARGKAGARGGVNRSRARALVLARLDRAERGCNLTTRRSPSIIGVKPAPRGWLVSVTVGGEAKGTSKWRVRGGEARPKNRLAKKINRRCS